ncbi:MAG: hypothetical protein ACI9LL_000931, partial [Porticoccus sp.]
TYIPQVNLPQSKHPDKRVDICASLVSIFYLILASL